MKEIAGCLLVIAIVIAIAALQYTIIFFGWNIIVADITGWRHISWWEAVLLTTFLIVIGSFFKSSASSA